MGNYNSVNQAVEKLKIGHERLKIKHKNHTYNVFHVIVFEIIIFEFYYW